MSEQPEVRFIWFDCLSRPKPSSLDLEQGWNKRPGAPTGMPNVVNQTRM